MQIIKKNVENPKFIIIVCFSSADTYSFISEHAIWSV